MSSEPWERCSPRGAVTHAWGMVVPSSHWGQLVFQVSALLSLVAYFGASGQPWVAETGLLGTDAAWPLASSFQARLLGLKEAALVTWANDLASVIISPPCVWRNQGSEGWKLNGSDFEFSLWCQPQAPILCWNKMKQNIFSISLHPLLYFMPTLDNAIWSTLRVNSISINWRNQPLGTSKANVLGTTLAKNCFSNVHQAA